MDKTKATVGAIIILIAGIGVATLSMILIGAMGGTTYQLQEDVIESLGTATYSGSFTALNTSWVSIGNPLVHNNTLTIVNATSVNCKGNFSINATTGRVLLTSGDASYNNTTMTVSYTYDTSTYGRAVRQNVSGGIVSSFKALKVTGDYLPIIVLAVVITLVLTLILGMTGVTLNSKKGGGNSGAL